MEQGVNLPWSTTVLAANAMFAPLTTIPRSADTAAMVEVLNFYRPYYQFYTLRSDLVLLHAYVEQGLRSSYQGRLHTRRSKRQPSASGTRTEETATTVARGGDSTGSTSGRRFGKWASLKTRSHFFKKQTRHEFNHLHCYLSLDS